MILHIIIWLPSLNNLKVWTEMLVHNVLNQGTTILYWSKVIQKVLMRATPLNNRDQPRHNYYRTIQRHQMPDREHLQEPRTETGIKFRKPHLRWSELGTVAIRLVHGADMQDIIWKNAGSVWIGRQWGLRHKECNFSNLWATRGSWK